MTTRGYKNRVLDTEKGFLTRMHHKLVYNLLRHYHKMGFIPRVAIKVLYTVTDKKSVPTNEILFFVYFFLLQKYFHFSIQE